jgi:hypothetical protein
MPAPKRMMRKKLRHDGLSTIEAAGAAAGRA